MFLIVLSTLMIPMQVIMIPVFIIASRIGIRNTLLGVILPPCAEAFGLFLSRQFINEIPDELEMGELIYIAYRCAALHSEEPVMTMQEFLTALTDDREEIGNVFQKLYGVQEKKQGFQKPSRKQRRDQTDRQ